MRNSKGRATAALDDRPILTIEIWSDVVCPWCYIGKRKFEAGLALFVRSRPEAEVNISYRAFQLDPTAPLGVSQKVLEVYAKKFGGPEKAKQILAHVTSEAEAVGIAFDMDRAQRANTVMAHRLLVLAEKHGVQLEMQERLMKAYFCEGEAIGEQEVLVKLAMEVGLAEFEATSWLNSERGSVEVADQLEAAADLGITSVPTFVINRSFGIPGAQSPEYFARVLEKMASQMSASS